MTDNVLVNIHAVGLLTMVLVTMVLIKRFKSQKRNFLEGLIAAGLLFIFLSLLTSHSSLRGDPVHQWSISAGCLFLLIAFVGNQNIKLLPAIGVIILSFVFSMQYNSLVSTAHFVGSADYPAFVEKKLMRSYVISLVESKQASNIVLPPGNLLRSLEAAQNPQLTELAAKLSKNVQLFALKYLWHSWFTGVYGIEKRKDVDIWFPGGVLKDSIERFEFRNAS
jgi:hypothetical protein